MKLLLLGALMAMTAHAEMDCGDSQPCCIVWEKEHVDTKSQDRGFTCINEGDKEGQDTDDYRKCFNCLTQWIRDNTSRARELIEDGKCYGAKHLYAYCENLRIEDGGGDDGSESSDDDGEESSDDGDESKDDGDDKVIVEGPDGSQMNCNQWLVDTCCQWGGESVGCKACLARNMWKKDGNGLGTKFSTRDGSDPDCVAPDISFYCETDDWDLKMKGHNDGDGLFEIRSEGYCTENTLTSKGDPGIPQKETERKDLTDCSKLVGSLCTKNPKCDFVQRQCMDACSTIRNAKECKNAKVDGKKRCKYAKGSDPPCVARKQKEKVTYSNCGEGSANKKYCKNAGKALKGEGAKCKFEKTSGKCIDVAGECGLVDQLGLIVSKAKKFCAGKMYPKKRCVYDKKGKTCQPALE